MCRDSWGGVDEETEDHSDRKIAELGIEYRVVFLPHRAVESTSRETNSLQRLPLISL